MTKKQIKIPMETEHRLFACIFIASINKEQDLYSCNIEKHFILRYNVYNKNILDRVKKS